MSELSFGQARAAAQLAQAMAKGDEEAMNRVLEDASLHWGFHIAAEIDAYAQHLAKAAL